MNYRHAFHSGNHADVLKHATLATTLALMTAKRKPLVYLDFFAGAGSYDLLLDERAERTGEWRDGVARIWGERGEGALAAYLSTIASLNSGGALRRYPGSPLIAATLLRADDRLRLVELHPDEAETLRRNVGEDQRVRVTEDDGWLAARSFLPPTPRRGLALFDPPFEKPNDFQRLVDALAFGLSRWATGVYLFWYPIVDRRAVRAYETAVTGMVGETPTLLVELIPRPDQARGLVGSGLICVNPPFGLSDRMQVIGDVLSTCLAAPDAGGYAQRWLAAAK